ncbi:hypothetical protein COCSUDRAFT_32314 [Coccomyxa subellipsoidea C-169]|uniref:Uncharacterized protein n=1 Tax=Coccomyxa subellipsoidea (strain C-169) TaxID=574566 RepID=I0Z8I6_COCSC|nr:hypothetical protein COCSUDRAFT_32314 [Coccomyxa subellipsoidea C-169]EIE26955.1 hypothetical protein COCSUDRAFT_32314 [Coccomyxa subellipsoidea C-169]|eukprot:XP_005651499.1 hypothetical protein COCSUDRAFT_32314 [Coccomyxa subellipsoidea C-169]
MRTSKSLLAYSVVARKQPVRPANSGAQSCRCKPDGSVAGPLTVPCSSFNDSAAAVTTHLSA